jgi:tetratricopeptide (TPR) repeat protein
MLLTAVSVTYSNHFQNPFHFDDSHAVVDNPYIRSLSNAPRFFTDAQTFSNLPANRVYRPLVPLSLAFDYWLGHGLKPAYFQASTFFWFLAQLVLMYALFRKVCDLARPDPRNEWVALIAVAWYGLHPAIAETVNYVIQRGEVYSTLGVIAGIWIYAVAPGCRKYGLYLLPVAAAVLSKPPALIFPALLYAYVALFEQQKPMRALKQCVPALSAAIALGYLTSAMTPKNFAAGAVSAFSYRLTQPLVALRYFRAFFLPDQLTADTDHVAVASLFQDGAWLGVLFVIGVVSAAIQLSRRSEWRPAAFGLWWFLIALLPAAFYPLAEVENDHRMFFPFVGLVLAVSWSAALWVYSWRMSGLKPRLVLASVCVILLTAYASGTWQRNVIWHSDESLWLDVTEKSPRNGRGLMNYGLTQMAKGETRSALGYFERALVFNPAYYVLETNLGVAYGAVNENGTAERHFLRAIQLAPLESTGHYFYGAWLGRNKRWPEAIAHFNQAIENNPDFLSARYALMDALAQQGEWPEVLAAARGVLERFPGDETAARYLSRAQSPSRFAPASFESPESWLDLSLSYHQAGKYEAAIDAAHHALKLKPEYAEAYNNISAAYEAMKMWAPAIQAAREALRLRPDFELARNNLRWSESQMEKPAASR